MAAPDLRLTSCLVLIALGGLACASGSPTPPAPDSSAAVSEPAADDTGEPSTLEDTQSSGVDVDNLFPAEPAQPTTKPDVLTDTSPSDSNEPGADGTDTNEPTATGDTDTGDGETGDSHDADSFDADTGPPPEPSVITSCIPPQLVSTLPLPSFDSGGVDLDDYFVYRASPSAGFQVIDTANKLLPSVVATISTPVPADDVSVYNNTAWVVGRFAGLHSYDITDPYNPELLYSDIAPYSAHAVKALGSIVYVADKDGALHIYLILDPLNPEKLATIPLSGEPQDVLYHQGYVYVAAGAVGVHVIEALSPTQPQYLTTFDTPGYARDLATNFSDLIYLADESSLYVIDIDDPADPQTAGWHDFAEGSQINGVASVGTAVFSAGSADMGYQAYDAQQPSFPEVQYTIPLPSMAGDIEVDAYFAYLTGPAGLWIIDRYCLDWF